MPTSYDRIVVHDIFSTKYRQPWINEKIEPELHSIIAAELIKMGCTVFQIGGTSDHVHLLHTLPRTKSIAEIMNAVKSVSSGWMHRQGEQYEWFAWQEGYGTFSADYRNLDGLISYIKNQRQHHANQYNRVMTFQQEYTKVLKAYGYQDFTSKYVFPDKPRNQHVDDPPQQYGQNCLIQAVTNRREKRNSFRKRTSQGRRSVYSSKGVHPLENAGTQSTATKPTG